MDFTNYERLRFERRGRELRITIENGRLNAVDFPMHNNWPASSTKYRKTRKAT